MREVGRGWLLGTAGALALRFAIFHAGKASARDLRATFRHQRQGRETDAAEQGQQNA